MTNSPAAVVLDVDGTLVDTNYQHALAWFPLAGPLVGLSPVLTECPVLVLNAPTGLVVTG